MNCTIDLGDPCEMVKWPMDHTKVHPQASITTLSDKVKESHGVLNITIWNTLSGLVNVI